MQIDVNHVTGQVVDAAVRLHMALGPGLLERIYEQLLALELSRRGLRVERQKAISFEYDGCLFTNAFRLDLLVEGIVAVEVKSVRELAAVHWKVVHTYIRLAGLPTGLLINFGAARLKDGLHRIHNSSLRV